MVMMAQFLRCPSPGNEMVGCIQYVLKCSNPKYLHLLLVEKWEVIFPQIENKVFRGDIFLDVEICQRWSCYLLLQPMLLLLLPIIVVVKIATSNFLPKASKKKLKWTN